MTRRLLAAVHLAPRVATGRHHRPRHRPSWLPEPTTPFPVVIAPLAYVAVADHQLSAAGADPWSLDAHTMCLPLIPVRP